MSKPQCFHPPARRSPGRVGKQEEFNGLACRNTINDPRFVITDNHCGEKFITTEFGELIVVILGGEHFSESCFIVRS